VTASNRPDSGLDFPVAEVPFEERRPPEEGGDELRLGALEHRFGAADLLDLSLVHHGDAVRDGERLLLVVGDGNRGDAGRFQDLADFLAHLDAEPHVEVRERLVEEEHVGLRRERPRECDALFLPTGGWSGVSPCSGRSTRSSISSTRSAVASAPSPSPNAMLFPDGEVGKQREVLEDDPDIALFGGRTHTVAGDGLVAERNLSLGRFL